MNEQENSWTYGNKTGAVQLVMTLNEHPEYYDPDLLFEKATDADKERAKEAIAAAREAFGK